MDDLKKLGWMSVVSIALFALAGCSQASAGSQAVEEGRPAAVEVAQADTQPTADADADNGPGCAESALDAAAQKK
ncbi:MAG: hypothetical protein ACLQDQ_19865 [Myxococcaceae bacterium]